METLAAAKLGIYRKTRIVQAGLEIRQTLGFLFHLDQPQFDVIEQYMPGNIHRQAQMHRCAFRQRRLTGFQQQAGTCSDA